MNDKDPKVSKDSKDTKDELDIIQHNEHTKKEQGTKNNEQRTMNKHINKALR